MKVAQDTSAAAQSAIAVLALLGLIGGWIIVVGGGFHTTPYRRAGYTLWVDGGPAAFMALLCFLWASIGLVALLKIHCGRLWIYTMAIGVVWMPPVLYLL